MASAEACDRALVTHGRVLVGSNLHVSNMRYGRYLRSKAEHT